MSKRWTYKDLESFGRARLSKNFYMREFLHSEIAQVNGLLNAPDDPDLAMYSGSQLCEHVLEPIAQTWGRVHIRSGYRSPEVNQLGNMKKLNCASNEKNYAAHIWDSRDSSGFCGATACIVIPAYANYFDKTGDWTSLAWWIHHHIPDYSEMCFFKEMCAFNIRWHEGESKRQTIKSFIVNPDTGDKSALVSKGDISPYYQGVSVEERCLKACELLTVL